MDTVEEVWKRLLQVVDGVIEGPALQLLPGIPNEITLFHITPKLPWRTFHVLSSVSRSWQQAIQSHEVRIARVRALSTETLAVVNVQTRDGDDLVDRNYKNAIALYSKRDRCFRQVPPIPQREQFPAYSQCVSSDGKLYVLGGMKYWCRYPSKHPLTDLGSAEVYVLDLAGQKQWRKCSSMREPRHQFGCGVLDGKIYVFGGTSRYHPVCGSEVYDPKLDAWSPVSPMRSLRFGHRVTAVGGELVVYGGQVYGPDYSTWGTPEPDADQSNFVGGAIWDHGGIIERHPLQNYIHEPDTFWEIYHPVKNEWRTVKGEEEWREILYPQETEIIGILPMAEGKLCVVTWDNVNIHDITPGGDSDGTPLHSLWPDESSQLVYDEICEPFSSVVVDGELLVAVFTCEGFADENSSSLFQSKGFSSQNRDITWQRAPWYGPYSDPTVMSILCCLQL